MTDDKMNTTDDYYVFCPYCGSFHIYRDIRDGINSCHGCGFTHFVGVQTVRQAYDLCRLDNGDNGDNGDDTPEDKNP